MLTSKFWQLLTDTVYCFTLYPYILNHKYRTRKYGENTDEKFGKIAKRNSDRDCLLVHAVSVGEVIAAQPVIDEFRKNYPDWDIHISVSTATGREVACKRYPDIPVSFFPLDISCWVKRFFANVKPSAIILMELEIWPNFLEISKSLNIPVIVANGRITEKSTNTYAKYKWVPILRRMLSIPRLWLAQNKLYAKRFEQIGVAAEKIKAIGSVKYDTIPTTSSSQLCAKYRNTFNTPTAAKIIIAGSTHNPEEEIILQAYAEMKSKGINAQLILVPRHPHRFDDVFKIAQNYGTAVKYTSIEDTSIDTAQSTADIVVIDKMGILSELYNAGDIVFIGGSFIEHGGQSMLEPCGLGKATVIGASYYNFTDTVEILKEAEGLIILNKPDELSETFCELLNAEDKCAKLGNNARTALLQHQGCSRLTIVYLAEFINEHKDT